jgi:hypothetical protein
MPTPSIGHADDGGRGLASMRATSGLQARNSQDVQRTGEAICPWVLPFA